MLFSFDERLWQTVSCNMKTLSKKLKSIEQKLKAVDYTFSPFFFSFFFFGDKKVRKKQMCLRVGFVLIFSIHYNSPKRNEKKDVEQKNCTRTDK